MCILQNHLGGDMVIHVPTQAWHTLSCLPRPLLVSYLRLYPQPGQRDSVAWLD